MQSNWRLRRAVWLFLFFFLSDAGYAPARQTTEDPAKFPYPEKLSYHIEWHSILAGQAKLDLSRASPQNWELSLNLESAGVVSRLYRVLDSYKVQSNLEFCGSNSVLDAQEGKRHRITRLTFQNSQKKVAYEEHDVLKNTSTKNELDIPPCTHEIAGALASLRLRDLEPGKTIFIPITDGKKLANAKIEAQGKESVTIDDKKYNTVRLEAYLFDNVLYSRKGRLFVWLTDDTDRIPVQFRIQLGFPIGTILLQLDKREKP
jgi:Protein of unknown function (DUF3108)